MGRFCSVVLMGDKSLVTSVLDRIWLLLVRVLQFNVIVVNLAGQEVAHRVVLATATLVGKAWALREHTKAILFDLLGPSAFNFHGVITAGRAMVLLVLTTIAVCHITQVLGRSSYDGATRGAWNHMSPLLIHTAHFIDALLRTLLERRGTTLRLALCLLAAIVLCQLAVLLLLFGRL